MTIADLHFKIYKGVDIQSIIDPLAALRMAVFYDFPYLYEGSIDYERAYLATYTAAPEALVYAVFDGDSLVGATTCLPLSAETAEVQQPFLMQGQDVQEIFYFGESLLLPPYRGLGIGHRFFDVREAHAQQFEAIKMVAFCAVDRPDDHPLRPIDYRPNTVFWAKRGYERQEKWQCQMAWQERGEAVSSPKTLTFWTKMIR